MNTQHILPQSIVTAALIASCGAFACGLSGCAEEDQQTSEDPQTEEVQAAEEETQDSITAHGSEYEKAETVQATTSLTGKVSEIAVEEWIKNPDELDEITDESSLTGISADDEDTEFTQDGTKIIWKANGEDVHYSGVTDRELPFNISYTYELDGKEVDPGNLTNATGELKIKIKYQNNTDATVEANGTSYSVKEPYTMATLMSFDSEHAKNVKVDNGQVMDQDGSFVAVGLAMPGLAKSLELEDELDLPESVTITADVTGFEIPSITTMATNQALGMVDENSNDVDESIDDLFSQTSQITEAIDKLSEGSSAIGKALDKISSGQKKLNKALPQASDGLSKLSEASSGMEKLVSGSKEAVDSANSYEAAAAKELENLKVIDQSALTEEQATALNTSIATIEANLTAAQQYSQGASSALEKAGSVSGQLTKGISGVTEGLEQIQSGYKQLQTATEKVSSASSQLTKGTETMGTSIKNALSEAKGSINNKLDLVSALSDYAEAQGAFCGNASDMPASTTYVVTAKADA